MRSETLDQWNQRHAYDQEDMVDLGDWSLAKEDKPDAARMRRERLLALRSALTKAKQVKVAGKGNDTNPGSSSVAPNTDPDDDNDDDMNQGQGDMSDDTSTDKSYGVKRKKMAKFESVDLSRWAIRG